MVEKIPKSITRQAGVLLVAGALCQQANLAQGAIQTDEPTAMDEVVVTARKREERLQDVPNVITMFDASTIEAAGISKTSDYMQLTPNLNYRDGSDFQSGFYFITMRGIGNGQDGWPSVAILIDGVRETSLAAIDSGQLVDIKRIEVVHGPQSALYGAGAIAGAVNIITKAPTNDFEARVKAGYAKGNDRSASAMLSGPIVADKLLFRINGTYRDSDGLISSASNGIDLDFQKLRQFDGRLIYNAADTLNFDLHAQLIREENGALYQPKYEVGAPLDPGAAASRRAFPGTDNRNIASTSLKAEWNLGPATLVSVSGWNRVRNRNLASACWDDPNDPQVVVSANPGLEVGCLFNPFLGAFGNTAPPGAPIDQYFAGKGDYKSFTSDLRIVSNAKDGLQWMLGAEYMNRDNELGFDTGLILAPERTLVSVFPQFNLRKDSLLGVYTQLSLPLRDVWELTVAGRYDRTRARNTAYTDDTYTVPIPVPVDGIPSDTQRKDASKFQPKVQIAYHWSPAVMTYATVARGFQAGFFSAGQYSAPQETENYEIGFKSALHGGQLVLNGAAFHINYSKQQFSTVVPTPPFLQVINIPNTKIDGAELELTWQASRRFSVGGSLGYLDTRVSGTNLPSPGTPDWTATVMASYSYPLTRTLNLALHGDYRYQGSQILDRPGLYVVSPKNYLNLRAGIEAARWKLDVFGRNVTDTRQFTVEPGLIAGGLVPGRNKPASYGVEVTYSF